MPESEGRKAFLRKQFFRLLPVQILLIAIGCLNSVIDGAVASSHLGADAMAVIGLYSPLAKLVDASIAVFLGGTQILCGRFLGKNEVENTQQAFSLDIVVTSCFSGLLMVLCLAAPGAVAGALGGSGEIRNDLSMYLLGMSFGIPCQMIGSQLSAFLQLERQEKRTYTGIAVMVVLNVGLDLLLVPALGFLGLGLATSASNLAFCAIQIYFFLTDKATIRFRFRSARLKHLKEILHLGLPGALVQGCLMVRGLVLNQILLNFCAPYGLPAFSAVNAFGCLYCAVYLGMGSATRLLSSVYIGEEDRASLADTLKTALTWGLLLVTAEAAVTFALAVPFASLFFTPADGAWDPAVLFFRVFPLSVPLSAVFIVFNNYYQSLGRMKIVNILSVMDGVAGTCLFSILMAPSLGSTGVWAAQVLNGVATLLLIPVCAWVTLKRMPRNLEDMMLLPEGFGVPDGDRMDIAVGSEAEALQFSDRVIAFCLDHGIEKKRAYAAGLCLEEMAVNVIRHGFRGEKNENVIVRVVYKGGELMIRLKDSCPPFNPKERAELFDPEDKAHNIGIRMASRLSRKMEYQFILGLNVLTLTL